MRNPHHPNPGRNILEHEKPQLAQSKFWRPRQCHRGSALCPHLISKPYPSRRAPGTEGELLRDLSGNRQSRQRGMAKPSNGASGRGRPSPAPPPIHGFCDFKSLRKRKSPFRLASNGIGKGKQAWASLRKSRTRIHRTPTPFDLTRGAILESWQFSRVSSNASSWHTNWLYGPNRQPKPKQLGGRTQ